MRPKTPQARFHIESGPSSLFERVKFKFSQPKQLQTKVSHFQTRAIERDAPLEEFVTFDPATWEIIMAEVRIDTGKFVNTTWQLTKNGERWWVVIGYGESVMTVIKITPGRSGKWGDSIVRSGELYDFVSTVNKGLMDEESNAG